MKSDFTMFKKNIFMLILFGYILSLYWGFFFQFSSWTVDSKLTKRKDWRTLCKVCMRVFLTGDWKVFDVGKFSSLENKSFGQMFQGGDSCYKGSLRSGFVGAANRLREPLVAVALPLVLRDCRSSLVILVVTAPISLLKSSLRKLQFLAIWRYQRTPRPTICRV